MQSQTALIEEFKNGASRGSASHMYVDGDVLYSYGHHFPLAVRYDLPGGYKFLINADRYSVTTAGHQGRVFGLGPQVPFSALRAAGIEPRESQIIDARKDDWHEVPAPTPQNPDATRQEHTLGAVLLEHRDRHYVSSLDENEPWRLRSYFLCRLPRVAHSVTDAFDSLVPDKVKEYRTFAAGKDVRQGEWFFLPSDISTRHLPRPTYWAAPLLQTNHYVTELRSNRSLYARGNVRHRPPNRARQHRRLSLGPTWHEAVKNLAVASWNAEGNVD